jgi:hypothetical protein
MLKWTLTCITAVERNVLREIYGLVLVNGQQQHRYNHEMYRLYNAMEQTRIISLRGLQWVGHVTRMKDEGAAMKALKGYIEGRRPVGRSRGRWSDVVDRDNKRMLKCKDWRSAEDVHAWRWGTEEAKAGCSATEEAGGGGE